jgi:Ca2+-binding EF-hand superfamily protein
MKHRPKSESEQPLDMTVFGVKHILANFEKNTGGKIGTVGGAGIGAGIGGGLGVIAGTSTLVATIGSFIIPGAGTLIGSVIGGSIGMALFAFGGALVGSDIGSRLDPHEAYIDKQQLDADVEKLIGSGVSMSTGSLSGVFTGVKGVVAIVFERYSKGKCEIPSYKLKLMFQDLGWYMQEDELEAIRNELDTNRDGILVFDEFYNWYESSDKFVKVATAIHTAKSIAEEFRRYDKDHSGKLDKDEFALFYNDFVKRQKYENPHPMEEVLKMIELDSDGCIPYNEFVNFEMQFFKDKYDLDECGKVKNSTSGSK